MRSRTPLFITLAAIAVFSCDHDTEPQVAVPGDYYPTTRGRLTYLRESINPVTQELFMSDTIEVGYDRDTVFNDKTYSRLEYYSNWRDANNNIIPQQDLYRLFRTENNQYFLPYSSGTSEYMFLDTKKGVGESWIFYGGFDKEIKTTYTVKAVNESRIVNGVEYRNVIEILAQTYYLPTDGKYELSEEETSYYAKDIGEIYRNSEWYTYSGISRLTLLK